MRKIVMALAVGLLVPGGLATAPAAYAGCQGGWTPWGGGTICDGPIAVNGMFQRCQTTSALGFGGTSCFLVDANNLAGQPPWVGP